MPLIGLFFGNGPTGFGHNSTAEQVTEGLDLSGKNVLVTGVRSGLGAETVRVLRKRGAHVLATGRKKEDAAAGDTALACELSEPASVRECVAAVKATGRKLDAIIANAGVMALATLQVKHGLELQFLTNHVGHFALVTGLLDALKDDGRVVMLSSQAHIGAPRVGIDFDNLDGSKGYHPWTFYGQTKLANLLFAKSLAKRFAGTKRTANAVHPGVIRTELSRHLNVATRLVFKTTAFLWAKSVPQGAATPCYVAVHPAAAGISGEYWSDSNLRRSTRHGYDMALAEKLWTRTEEILSTR